MGMEIGQNISAFRKEARMTQEELAEAIGVSAQSVSKWETGTTYPDILLLPIIADTLNTDTDALFGRRGRLPAGSDLYATMEELFLDTLHECFTDGDDDKYEADGLKRYKEALRVDSRMNSAVITRGKGMVLYNNALGAALLKCPQGGWAALFDGYAERLRPLFQRLADPGFASMMGIMTSKPDYSFTAKSMVRKAGMEEEAVKGHLDYLVANRILGAKTLELDDTEVTVYNVNAESKLIPLLGVLAFASYYNDYMSVYRGYMGDGQFYIQL